MKSLICFEIVGLPGSGKTSLALELKNRHSQFRLALPPDWKQLRSLPFYVRHSILLAPAFASMTLGRRGRWLNVEEFLWMIFLNGWHRQLTLLGTNNGVIILDQGPVFMMSQMILFREGQMANPLFGNWWKKMLGEWRAVLKGIVWLDSSDNVLAHRINTRQRGHLIKGVSFSQARDFLERRRMILDQAVSMIRADHQAPSVMCFNTGQLTLEEIADSVSGELSSYL